MQFSVSDVSVLHIKKNIGKKTFGLRWIQPKRRISMRHMSFPRDGRIFPCEWSLDQSPKMTGIETETPMDR